MPKVPAYNIQNYSYYHLDGEGEKKFGQWLDNYNWTGVLQAVGPDQAVEQLHLAFEEGVKQSSEYKTRKKKSSEPNWMAEWLRDLIKDRRRVFRSDGFRSERWKTIKKKMVVSVKKRRSKCNQFILNKIEAETTVTQENFLAA